MRYGLRYAALGGTITGPDKAPAPEGAWIESFDPDAYGGRGDGTWTLDPAEALAFDSPAEALAFWQQESRVRPVRQDGRPNRPLTALAVWIEQLPERQST